jgi:hypothetical protein
VAAQTLKKAEVFGMYLFDACLFLIVVLLISDALQLMLREI